MTNIYGDTVPEQQQIPDENIRKAVDVSENVEPKPIEIIIGIDLDDTRITMYSIWKHIERQMRYNPKIVYFNFYKCNEKSIRFNFRFLIEKIKVLILSKKDISWNIVINGFVDFDNFNLLQELNTPLFISPYVQLRLITSYNSYTLVAASVSDTDSKVEIKVNNNIYKLPTSPTWPIAYYSLQKFCIDNNIKYQNN